MARKTLGLCEKRRRYSLPCEMMRRVRKVSEEAVLPLLLIAVEVEERRERRRERIEESRATDDVKKACSDEIYQHAKHPGLTSGTHPSLLVCTRILIPVD